MTGGVNAVEQFEEDRRRLLLDTIALNGWVSGGDPYVLNSLLVDGLLVEAVRDGRDVYEITDAGRKAVQ